MTRSSSKAISRTLISHCQTLPNRLYNVLGNNSNNVYLLFLALNDNTDRPPKEQIDGSRSNAIKSQLNGYVIYSFILSINLLQSARRLRMDCLSALFLYLLSNILLLLLLLLGSVDREKKGGVAR